MEAKYQDFNVILLDESSYDPDSADNYFQYEFVYNQGKQYRYSSKHGIRIIHQDHTEISSALIVGWGGGTTIHESSFLIIGDLIFICCGNQVYSLYLPQLTLNWNNKIDDATCFGVYQFKDDLIVHGEMEIIRLTINGQVKWRFSGRDIFASLHRNDSFYISGDEIHVFDFEDNKYVLDGNGLGTLVK